MYQITQKFITRNRTNKPLKPVGTTIHSTATPGASDENEQNYYNTHNLGNVGVHAFVDWDSITQTAPWLEKCNHAMEPANSMFIGIEMCEPKDNDPSRMIKFTEAWKRATFLHAWVFVNILKINTVTKDNCMSHAEISAKWHNTNHTDPVVFFKKYGKTVDMFRADVQANINAMVKPTPTPTPTPQPQPTTQEAWRVTNAKGEYLGVYLRIDYAKNKLWQVFNQTLDATIYFYDSKGNKYFAKDHYAENSTPRKGMVTASLLNVRNNINGAVVGKLQKNAPVLIYGALNGWYLINNKTPQWVSAQFIKLV